MVSLSQCHMYYMPVISDYVPEAMPANSDITRSKRLPSLEAHKHSGENTTRNMSKVPQKQVEEVSHA